MLYIDPSKLLGRKFYVHDSKIIYTAIGYGQNETAFIVGEYPDPGYLAKYNRLVTHKLTDCKFTDFVPSAVSSPSPPPPIPPSWDTDSIAPPPYPPPPIPPSWDTDSIATVP